MPPRRQVTLSEAEIAGLIARSVAQALALRTQNPGSEDTANTAPQSKPCTYKDFQNCKPLSFQGTEGAIGLVRWIEKIESVFLICNCTEEDKVKFAASTFSDTALTWWNTYAQTVTIATAYKLQWDELKRMLRGEYCPRDELKQLEVEFWNHKMQGDDITGYTNRFHQLALLCPSMVDPEYKRVEKYVDGLPDRLQDLVTSSKPGSIQNAIRMAHELTANSVRRGQTPTSSANKRKWEPSPNSSNQITNKKPTTVTMDATKAYKGSKPYCSKCGLHHNGNCPCSKCKKFGHLTKDCPTGPADTNAHAPKTCYECNGIGHFKKDCPKLKSGTNLARGRAYVINAREEENPRLVDLLNPGTLVLPKNFSPYNFCLTISYFMNTFLDPKYSIGLENDRLLESRQRNLCCILNSSSKFSSQLPHTG